VTPIDIEYVKSVALEAGAQALRMQTGMTAEFKADNSFVTEIDKWVENFTRARLQERYPDFAFHGEEFGRHGSLDAPTWFVDPIDGTTNMVFGIPFWCVSIGLMEQGIPTAGVVYFPRLGEMTWGVRGEGAYADGRRLAVVDRDSIHPEDTLGFTSGAIKKLNPHVLAGRIRCLGSIAGDLVSTAKGSFCSHVALNEGVVDIVAALCIAAEAGCVAEYLTGEPLDLLKVLPFGKTQEPFVVAPPRMAALLQSLLRRRTES
jgi:myo-inositol-1(or 4)-monophosphatase